MCSSLIIKRRSTHLHQKPPAGPLTMAHPGAPDEPLSRLPSPPQNITLHSMPFYYNIRCKLDLLCYFSNFLLSLFKIFILFLVFSFCTLYSMLCILYFCTCAAFVANKLHHKLLELHPQPHCEWTC